MESGLFGCFSKSDFFIQLFPFVFPCKEFCHVASPGGKPSFLQGQNTAKKTPLAKEVLLIKTVDAVFFLQGTTFLQTSHLWKASMERTVNQNSFNTGTCCSERMKSKPHVWGCVVGHGCRLHLLMLWFCSQRF